MRRVASLLLACTVAACASDAPAEPLLPVASVSIDGAPADAVLLIGVPLTLRAAVLSTDGVPVSAAYVAWRSSDETRATVGVNGVVQAVGPGEVTVSATAAGITATRDLSVRTNVPLPTDGQPRTSTLLDGTVRITVNAGALPADGRLYLREDPSPPADVRLLAGTAIELGPAGVSFGAPVALSLLVPTALPLAERSFVRLATVVGGDWVELPSSDATTVPGRVSGAITRAGRYAIVRRGLPASLVIVSGNDQRGLPGVVVPITPTVRVRDAANMPLAGVLVRFAVTLGGGTILGADSAISNAVGDAALGGTWRLGPNTGANSLTASVVGVPGVSVTFAAVAEAVVLVVARQLSGAISGRTATVQPRLEFRTASGTLLPVSDGVQVDLLSGSGTLLGTRSINAVGGIATFIDLRIDGSGVHRLRFTSGGNQATGADFTVTQELASLVIITQPGGAVEDRKFVTQPAVRLLDDAGLPFLTSKTVTASRASGSGDLRGDVTATSVAGVALFNDLRIDNGSGTHTLRFATTSPTRTVISTAFIVAPN